MEDLPSIAVPTLILVGDQDLPFVDGTAYMEAKIPGAQRVVVEGATHGVNVDEPAIVNDALAAFLKVF
jgi:pimeloyl-ACP methyl ester carboxylesterase